jgi:hypothetical protein
VPHDDGDSEAYASHVPPVPPLQHPLGHVATSQRHAPLDVSHRPFVQEVQAAPPVPHCEAFCVAYGTQVLPLQHPFGHELALHTHAPLTHCWPDPQALHAAPPVPHETLDSEAYGSQVPLVVQQPEGQELALQPHCPLPVLHASPIGHAAHATPPAPHDELDSLESASQVPPVQQPAQVVPPQPHAPAEHESPDAHALHAAPPVPHWVLDCEAVGTQTLPAQHPPEQDAALHTHWPDVVLHV